MQPAKRASQKPFHTFKSIHNRVNIYQTGDFDADLKYKMVDTI